MFDETLKLILVARRAPPAAALPRRLDGLFERLAHAADAIEASQIEDVDLGLVDVARRRRRRGRARARHPRDRAPATTTTPRTLLDELVVDAARTTPRRGTSARRCTSCMGATPTASRDIHRTLELEPRHFGAICGFGQICLRRGERAAALFAFDAALRINPHLGAVRTAREELAARSATVRSIDAGAGLPYTATEPCTPRPSSSIVLAPRRRPSRRLHRRLDALLRRLADAASARARRRPQDEIWALWMTYPDRRAATELERATRAIVAEDFATAERILHRLVAIAPRLRRGVAQARHALLHAGHATTRASATSTARSLSSRVTSARCSPSPSSASPPAARTTRCSRSTSRCG